MKSLRALKVCELSQLNLKIAVLKANREVLGSTINELKPCIAENRATMKELEKYRKMKQELFYLQRRLNKKQMQLTQRTRDLEEDKLRMCFGTKKLIKAQYNLAENNFKTHIGWYNEFRKNRDKNIFYLGSKDETQGNQMLQLIYNNDTDDFRIKIRKENTYTSDSKYATGICDFKYQKEHLIHMLTSKEYPLTYRFRRDGRKWYLQIVIAIRKSCSYTTTANGVIGLDYNETFIELSETDRSGNLVNLQHLNLYKGTSEQTENALRTAVSKICKKALSVGKAVVIEDLDFKKTKGKSVQARSKAGKKYNRMLHSLDYSRYKETMLNTGHRLGVDILLVNPAYTSKTAKQKYCLYEN
jgi:IS605 OrfB family transposase